MRIICIPNALLHFSGTSALKIVFGTPTIPKMMLGRVVVTTNPGFQACGEACLSCQPTRKRTSRMVLPPKRCFNFRRISDLEIRSSS